MAHLWRVADAGDWEPWELDSPLLALGREARPRAIDSIAGADDGVLVVLRRAPASRDGEWLLLAEADASVHVNGLPVPHGIAALADRDEIRLPEGLRVFFSTERLAHVTPYPHDAPRGFCPRCKQPLQSGGAAVRCPGCGLWHHASTELPCWTYADHCAAGCPQPTALDAGFRWTPEDEV